MVVNSTKNSSGETFSARSYSLRVLLVGNYLRDRQESMQRFAQAMFAGLQERGISVELIKPEQVLGRFGASSHFGIGKWLAYLDKFLLFPLRLRQAIGIRTRLSSPSEDSATVVHLCDHSNAIYTRYLHQVAHLVTCHDMLAIRSALGEIPQNPTGWSGRRLQAMILRGLNRAQHVACVSKSTESDVLRLSSHARGAISVIPNSLNYAYSPMPKFEALPRVRKIFGRVQGEEPQPGFILHVGGNQWYKNRPGVLRIYARVVESGGEIPALVMVGEALSSEMKAFITAKRIETLVFRVESCGNEDLRALYSAAGVLLFPSLAEGFGWPVVEAQACGCPVVCGAIDPLPEVSGQAALLFESSDESGLADAVKQVITDATLRGQLIERGHVNAARFHPAKMIDDYLECYSELAGTAAGASTSRAFHTASSLLA